MDLLMYIVAILAVGLVFYMLVKRMDIKITLFATAIFMNSFFYIEPIIT